MTILKTGKLSNNSFWPNVCIGY